MLRIDAHQHYWRYRPQGIRGLANRWRCCARTGPKRSSNRCCSATVSARWWCRPASASETRTLLTGALAVAYAAWWDGWTLPRHSCRSGDELRQQPLLRGLRHLVQNGPQPAAWLERQEVQVRRKRSSGTVMSTTCWSSPGSGGKQFAARHDDYTGWCWIISASRISPGRATLGAANQTAGGVTYVVCKLSGLITGARRRLAGATAVAVFGRGGIRPATADVRLRLAGVPAGRRLRPGLSPVRTGHAALACTAGGN